MVSVSNERFRDELLRGGGGGEKNDDGAKEMARG
jgi:hypothetical protein